MHTHERVCAHVRVFHVYVPPSFHVCTSCLSMMGDRAVAKKSKYFELGWQPDEVFNLKYHIAHKLHGRKFCMGENFANFVDRQRFTK